MNTEVTVTYRTSLPPLYRGAYRVSYASTHATTYDLRQIGEVWNGVVTYRGIYTSRVKAKAAALEYSKGVAS